MGKLTTEDKQWIANAIDGNEECPNCGSEIDDCFESSTGTSWIECSSSCGFDYVYSVEKGERK